MSLAVAGAAALATSVVFARDVRRAEQKVTGRSQVIATRFGALEYATVGQGTPLLMIHGTGGGFDQGLLFADRLAERNIQVIAPSRFGYLGSAFPDDPSSERQADAFVELLDSLGVERVAVAGGSAGALSAVQFALRHPERCSALILVVPAANVRGSDPVEMTPLQAFAVRRITTSNLLFWLGLKTARRQMVGVLLATDPELVEAASPDEQRRAQHVLDSIMPVERRWRGMLNDAELAGRPARVDFSKLKTPTLVISVEDDRFGTAATARDIAAAAPAAKLVIYPSGGHIWIGHDEALWREVAAFVQASGDAPGRPVTR